MDETNNNQESLDLDKPTETERAPLTPKIDGVFKKKGVKKSKWFWIGLAAIILLLLLGGGYYFWQKQNDDKVATSDQPETTVADTASTTGTEASTPAATTAPTIATDTASSTATPATTVAPNPTEGWKTYTDSTYHASFKYPATWANAVAEGIVGEENTPTPVSYNSVVFGTSSSGKYGSRVAELSNYTAYANSNIAEDITTLKGVYTSKNAASAAKLWLPPGGASIMAASAPQYIETADGSWRGIYYFANIGQAYTTTLSCMIIMTDGSASIVQLDIAMESDNAAQYTSTLGQNENFPNYVKSLDLNSTETIVTEFKSIYKIIAQSLTSI